MHFVTSHSRFALSSFRNHAKNEAPEEEAGSRRHAFIFATKHEYSTGNEEWIKSETVTITRDYVVLEHFTSSLANNTNAPRKNEQYFYFSLALKDTEIFAKQLF